MTSSKTKPRAKTAKKSEAKKTVKGPEKKTAQPVRHAETTHARDHAPSHIQTPTHSAEHDHTHEHGSAHEVPPVHGDGPSHDHAHDHPHEKTAEAKATAPEKKVSHAKKPVEHNVEPPKKKRPAYPAHITLSKPKDIQKIREKLKAKRLPLFRGRFGKRGGARKISKEKWQRWRYPRGIDVYLRREDGALPQSGYRTPIEIRGRHPSGYKAVRVCNANELAAIKDPHAAIIIAHAVGRRKRIALIEAADARKLPVLNR